MQSVLAAACAAVIGMAPDDPGLRPEHVYNGVGRPVVVEVRPPEGDGALALLLMDFDGRLETEPAEVSAGLVDLAQVMPDVVRLRRAGFLQLVADEEPVGSALVVQPMLSRLVPITVEATNPSGITYTRVVGWYDETLSPEEREKAIAQAREAAPDRAASAVPPPPDDPWLANQDPGSRLFSGLRLYPERDVVLETTAGAVRLALRPDAAPNTVWNFRQLVAGGFYRDIPFHRIVPMTSAGDPFVIQAGDPTTTGSGGPGYWLPIEPSALAHDFGVISMARDVDPDSAGSQIFICLSRAGTARLDGHYCAFGVAVEGTETILDIAAAELADVATGRPVDPPVIRSATLVPSPPRTPGAGRPDEPVRRPVPPVPSAPPRVPR